MIEAAAERFQCRDGVARSPYFLQIVTIYGRSSGRFDEED
jgi:hypothetical protein